MKRFKNQNVVYTGIGIFLFVVAFIFTNFPEIRDETLIVFGMAVASYFFITKPKKLSEDVKIMIGLMAVAEAANLYFMFTVPEYFMQGMVYVLMTVIVLLYSWRKET